jgi:hypothetical protein
MKFSNDTPLEEALKFCDTLPTSFFRYGQVLSCLAYFTSEEVKNETHFPFLSSSDEQDEDIHSKNHQKNLIVNQNPFHFLMKKQTQ